MCLYEFDKDKVYVDKGTKESQCDAFHRHVESPPSRKSVQVLTCLKSCARTPPTTSLFFIAFPRTYSSFLDHNYDWNPRFPKEHKIHNSFHNTVSPEESISPSIQGPKLVLL